MAAPASHFHPGIALHRISLVAAPAAPCYDISHLPKIHHKLNLQMQLGGITSASRPPAA
jgi:hypothetical protein